MTIKLRPMSEAPKDREIFALLLLRDAYGGPRKDAPDVGNFHPIQWKDYPWKLGYRARWGMRWNDEFEATLSDYAGWFDPKDIEFT